MISHHGRAYDCLKNAPSGDLLHYPPAERCREWAGSGSRGHLDWLRARPHVRPRDLDHLGDDGVCCLSVCVMDVRDVMDVMDVKGGQIDELMCDERRSWRSEMVC